MAAVSDAAVAIFPWGDVIEEFLDPLGLTIEDYAERIRSLSTRPNGSRRR